MREDGYDRLAGGPLKVVANLPYNVATVLLTGWLTDGVVATLVSSLTLMFQKEVAGRIVATAAAANTGAFSVVPASLRCAKALRRQSRRLHAAAQGYFQYRAVGAQGYSNARMLNCGAREIDRRRFAKTEDAASSLKTLIASGEVSGQFRCGPVAASEQLPVEVFARLAQRLAEFQS